MDSSEVLEALKSLPPEAQSVLMAGLQKPIDMAQGVALSNIFWAIIDVAIAVAIYIPLCSWRPLSRFVFEYDEHLDKQALRLHSGVVKNPVERGMITQSVARVKSAKIMGFLLVMAASLIN